jgi:hypothetical protein
MPKKAAAQGCESRLFLDDTSWSWIQRHVFRVLEAKGVHVSTSRQKVFLALKHGLHSTCSGRHVAATTFKGRWARVRFVSVCPPGPNRTCRQLYLHLTLSGTNRVEPVLLSCVARDVVLPDTTEAPFIPFMDNAVWFEQQCVRPCERGCPAFRGLKFDRLAMVT